MCVQLYSLGYTILPIEAVYIIALLCCFVFITSADSITTIDCTVKTTSGFVLLASRQTDLFAIINVPRILAESKTIQ